MKSLLKKILPKSLFSIYHYFVVSVAAFFYGYPSKKIRVIGVTGTKGKSTTCFLIAKILEEGGRHVALASTASFKIGSREWLNPYKMTMLGRFALQRFIRDAVRAGCNYLVLEVSSEGIAQNRHRAIEFDVAVFTNLTPEHIDSHGSFEAYRAVKGKLFENLVKYPHLNPLPFRGGGRRGSVKDKKTIVVNLDDENAVYFLQFSADKKVSYGIGLRQAQAIRWVEPTTISPERSASEVAGRINKNIKGDDVLVSRDGSNFTVDGTKFHLNILGEFNVYNALAAIAVGQGEGIEPEVQKRALEKIKTVPGRVEFIDEGQPFKVIVDYAHEPKSLEEIFKAVKLLEPKRIIHVFGPTGGGRDIETRKRLGEISARNAVITIITTDDPYDDDPRELAKLPIVGAKSTGLDLENRLFVVLDRREAIAKAVQLAVAGDIVLITGKGSEQAMVIKGKKLPWDDRMVVREELLRALAQPSRKHGSAPSSEARP